MSAKVLVVDDEANIVELIKFNLEKNGFTVIAAYDGLDAINLVEQTDPDLVILDIMIPAMDGLEVCRLMKQSVRHRNLPIIMLTAKGEEIDTVLGLEMGADDYIKKPFSPRELVARVKARLRSEQILNTEDAQGIKPLIRKDLVIIPDKYEALVGDKKMDLTPKEFELLRILAANPGKVMTRDMLLEKVWGYEFFGDTRTVDVHIRHLRKKLEDDSSSPQYIKTIRGVGYKFCENEYS
ncbi:MAG: response regulator transcription factor [Syntrophomonadaceae bacterium]|nr:response regulator transcription factor [Syntrophomonadaceae bacterium]